VRLRLLIMPAALSFLVATPPADARPVGTPPASSAVVPVPTPAPAAAAPGPLHLPDTQLEPIAFTDLPGWADDDHARAFATFLASCRPIVRGQPPNEKTAGPSLLMQKALIPVCQRALAQPKLDREAARRFFEENFRPLRIAKLDQNAGFLTGYYEPIVDGSRFPTQIFHVPMYHRPPDLLAPDAPPGASFPNRGRVVRVTPSGEQVPYYDRGEIEEGALAGRSLEICWLKNPADLLTIQIQGSARVRLEDGLVARVNYDAHNGYPYTAVGRILIDRDIIPREQMSMAAIHDWMTAHPEAAKEVRRQNRAYVFFRVVGLSGDREPAGGQGVALTPGRSIAVDRPLHAYGTPFFIEAKLPLTALGAAEPFRRTMIAQDTGSAIVGPARADLYFGAGDAAGRVAGRIRQAGHFAMLVPREIDPVVAGAAMPLPRVRPPPEPEKPASTASARKRKVKTHRSHHHRRHKRRHWRR
jgi:membrane-bound lytic murein transglycosylase A